MSSENVENQVSQEITNETNDKVENDESNKQMNQNVDNQVNEMEQDEKRRILLQRKLCGKGSRDKEDAEIL